LQGIKKEEKMKLTFILEGKMERTSERGCVVEVLQGRLLPALWEEAKQPGKKKEKKN